MNGLIPAITGFTASVLILIQIGLSFYTVAGRIKFKASIGDGGHEEMMRRIRMHGNFCENAPMFLIVLGLAEMSHVNALLLEAIGAIFVLSRLSHAYGLNVSHGDGPNPFRFFGIFGSWTPMMILAIALLIKLS